MVVEDGGGELLIELQLMLLLLLQLLLALLLLLHELLALLLRARRHCVRLRRLPKHRGARLVVGIEAGVSWRAELDVSPARPEAVEAGRTSRILLLELAPLGER